MSAKRSKYENYDKEGKGKLWKVMKPLLIALAIVFGVCVLSLALEDSGVFPGPVLNKLSVSSFLKKQYGGGEVGDCRYDAGAGVYIYQCTVNGQPCEISAKFFRVRDNGYYDRYCRNTAFETAVEQYLNQFLNTKWADEISGYRADWSCEIDIPSSDSSFPADSSAGTASEDVIRQALQKYGGSLCFTVKVHGENISMEDYRGVVYQAVRILQQEMDNRPQHLQMFYYRSDGENDTMQYESALETYQFLMNETGIRTTDSIHRYVEVSGTLQTKVNIYYTVKRIFLVVVSVTVLALSVLWVVRRIRKYKKYKNSGV